MVWQLPLCCIWYIAWNRSQVHSNIHNSEFQVDIATFGKKYIWKSDGTQKSTKTILTFFFLSTMFNLQFIRQHVLNLLQRHSNKWTTGHFLHLLQCLVIHSKSNRYTGPLRVRQHQYSSNLQELMHSVPAQLAAAWQRLVTFKQKTITCDFWENSHSLL